MEPLQEGRVRRSILVVGSLAACGYLLSILRDALLATHYGGSSALDVYFIALSPAQFIGGEAASLAYLAFLPEFARAASGGDPSESRHLLRERLAFVTKSALGVGALFALVGAVFTHWLAPGYAGNRALASLRISVVVLSTLIPGLAVAGVMRAELEARGRFSAWALLPGFRSVALIACVLLSASRPALGWLLAGSLLGVMLAVGYAEFAGRDHGRSIPGSDDRPGRPVVSLPSSLVPLLGAILLGTLTTMVDNAFASKAGIGGPQAFALATNLLVAPQNIIGGGVATVFFPLYGGLWLSGREGEAFDSLGKSVRIAVYGLLPVVVLLATAGMVVVRVVYRHGAFTEDLAHTVTQAVAGLALGQIFFACTVLLRQFLLVAGEPWAVCEAAGVFLCVKWLANAVLIRPFGLPGVALASSLAALTTCAFLVVRVIHLARMSRERGA